MSISPKDLQEANRRPGEEVFLPEELHLLRAFRRHLTCAERLLIDPSLSLEAEFHGYMAVECLLKHLFCLTRFAAGVRAQTDSDFGKITYVKEFGHKLAPLADKLKKHVPALTLEPLFLAVVNGLPPAADWNETRYSDEQVPDARRENLRHRLDSLTRFERGLLGS